MSPLKNFFKIFVRFASTHDEIPFFLDTNYSKPLNLSIDKKDDNYDFNENQKYKEKKNTNFTFLNNIYDMNNVDLFDKLIKVYVDIIYSFSKYPIHVQYLHIFCSNLLKEKVKNVKISEEHKRLLFNKKKSDITNLNEYLMNLNEAVSKSKSNIKQETKIFQDAFENIKKFYYHKNVIYAFFTMESNKIVFNFTNDILFKDIENCLINYTLNTNKEIYRFIKKYGKDNIYIYILEYVNSASILKDRYNCIKNLFYGI